MLGRIVKRHSGKKEKIHDQIPPTEDEGTEKMVPFMHAEAEEENEADAIKQGTGPDVLASSSDKTVIPPSVRTGSLPSNLVYMRRQQEDGVESSGDAQPTYFSTLDIQACPEGKVTDFWVKLTEACTGTFVSVPVLVAKGTKPGPVVGMVAAVHGEEVNGTPLIHAFFNHLRDRVDGLSGTVVGVPVANIPAFNLRKRVFPDQSRDVDLNRLFPGKANGSTAEKYAYYFFTKIVVKFDYLLDLHTACNGNLNCSYVRADLSDPRIENMAKTVNGDLILHSKGPTGGAQEQGATSLRDAATNAGIPSVCLEIGEPNEVDPNMIGKVYAGLYRLLLELKLDTRDLRFEKENNKLLLESKKKAMVCRRSYWLFTDHGGLLTVHTKLLQRVKKGDHVATVTNLFGFVLQKLVAPEDGVVIGQSQNPVQDPGGRILHLGVVTPHEDWLPAQPLQQRAAVNNSANLPEQATSPVGKSAVPRNVASPTSKLQS
eukprot:g37340.t1